jgi:hypothetical protein
LLPSGKVLIGGGNLLDATHLRFDFQVYAPWYIVAGLPRPQIVDVNGGVEQIGYDQIFRIKHEVLPGLAINKVVLIHPGSVTHGFNSDQRYIELEISPPVEEEGVEGEIMARMPPRAPGHPAWQPTDVTGPPGFYMLFLVSTSRVPSEAAWVELLP